MKILCIILLLCCWIKTTEAELIVIKPVKVIISNEFNKENLLKYIKYKNIKYPHIVYAQAILESGHFKSKLFRKNNNLFGMRHVRTNRFRNTTSIGSRHKHAVYSTWKLSVDDYLLWQNMYDISNEQDYYKLLAKKYAADKKYVKCLKKIIKRYG